MCKYCDGWENKTFDNFNPYPINEGDVRFVIFNRLEQTVNVPTLWGLTDDGYDSFVSIKYCPFCGKKLI